MAQLKNIMNNYILKAYYPLFSMNFLQNIFFVFATFSPAGRHWQDQVILGLIKPGERHIIKM